MSRNLEKELARTRMLLRRFVRLIINSVEYDSKMSPFFLQPIRVPRDLGLRAHRYLRCNDPIYINLLRRRRRHEKKHGFGKTS